MMNQIVLVGRLARDPELIESENGGKYSNITLAVPRTYKNIDGEPRLQNIEPVDLVLIGKSYSPRARPGRDLRIQRIALLFRKLFRVVQALNAVVWIENDCRCVNRSGQWAAACLVHTADRTIPLLPQITFKGIHQQSSGGSSSVMRPSLPERNSSSSTRAMRSVSYSPLPARNPRFLASSVSVS